MVRVEFELPCIVDISDSKITVFTSLDLMNLQLLRCHFLAFFSLFYVVLCSYRVDFQVGEETSTDKFSEIAQYNIVDVKGDDSIGRKVIVLYACRLPPIKDIDHGRFLR